MTDRYAVIGNPIAHSKSPLIHTRFARSTGQDLDYGRIESTPEGFTAAVRAFRDGGGRGLNVTTPFKLQAFELATEQGERARIAGAANAMKFEDGGRIVVDNFDGLGLANDIERNLGVALKGRRVLMLGAGGAARGALVELLARGPAELLIANRTRTTAQDLANKFAAQGPLRACSYEELAVEAGFDIVLNGTSASMTGVLPPVPASAFSAATLAYEMVYGRGLTPFLRLAKDAGVPRLADGVGMLVEQAAEAFVWWRGVRPETQTVIDELTVPLT